MTNNTFRWVLLSSLVLACQSPTKERIGTTTVQRIELSPQVTPSWNPDENGQISKELEELETGPCPKNSVLVEGEYCPRVSQQCETWVSRKGEAIPEAKPADGESGRCGTFKYPTKCLEKKVHVKFCIDKYEFPNVEGQVPQAWTSYWEAKSACEARDQRLCEKEEWTFACEGPDMHPLPYGDGYHRDSSACNLDKKVPEGVTNTLTVKGPLTKEGILLDEMRETSGLLPRCVSPFGVSDMVGNVDEWVHYSQGHLGTGDPKDRGPYTSELVGGAWYGVRNACRPMTAHDESFRMFQTGFRCCANPKL